MDIQISIDDLINSVRDTMVLEHGNLLIQSPDNLEDIIRDEVDKKLNGHIITGFSSNDEIKEYVISRLTGLGPIDILLHNDSLISEIMINGPEQVYIERAGTLLPTDIVFKDSEEVMNILDRIVRRCGRKINYKDPTVDARIGEMRVNAVIPPSAQVPYITIRRFVKKHFSTEEFVGSGFMTSEMAATLEVMVKGKCNIIVVGPTGCGKTTFIRWLCDQIPENERVITIEDTSELNLNRKHLVKLEASEMADIHRLLINSLRMRPDRIIIGEVRGPEALLLLDAMGTGHEGSISSIHANAGQKAAIQRYVRASLMVGTISEEEIKAMMCEILNSLIFIKRFPDGTRRLVSISQVEGIKNGEPVFRDIYKFNLGMGHVFQNPFSNELIELMSDNLTSELPMLPAFKH